MYKNIEKDAIIDLKEEIEYREGEIASKTLVQNEKVSITLFSFEKGEEISTHTAGGDALVTVLDGVGKFVVDGKERILRANQSLIMPKDVPHSVYGEERFKMMLIVSC
ncbi:MAG: cupin domain-containing protein [Christensenellales bacterium]